MNSLKDILIKRFKTISIKIIYLLLLVLFLGVLNFFFQEDFVEFNQQKHQYEASLDDLEKGIQAFDFSLLKDIEISKIQATPNLGYLDTLVKKVDGAKNYIYLNTYIFTEKRIREALIKAKNRWVEVKVILEKNVYKSPNLNNDTFDILSQWNVWVVWSDSQDFSLNHAKYMIIDDYLILSTWNYSYSTFKQNRDIFLEITDTQVVGDMRNLFLNDYIGNKSFFYSHNTVLANYDARKKIVYLIKNAQKSIDMYVPYLYDTQVFEELKNSIQRGVILRLVTSEDSTLSNEWEELKKLWAQIYLSDTTIHAKTLLIDEKILLVWSINFSFESIEKNREAGVILIDQKIIQTFLKVFQKDFIN